MAVTLNPYLNFRTGTREAMEFYQSVLGGELNVSTFADYGMAQDPADADKVMHSQLTTPDGLTLMAADVPAHMDLAPASSISVSLSGDDEAKLRGFYDALAAGGTVLEPLTVAPWGDSFGMVVDKFGTTWLVNIAGTPAA
ncbi:VOC family protein [Cellulomonas fimi]|uniref:Glyoxalase/bleomycin resistance protein/dioxygenase n=1 Tax=Cellulomonas fimi (strain ATCC 484 / DSM 20113 / JCM 1341 / CCUG 24087 / LMG 16345 / NBRC 15513 / NCIMB 8980 / NCTC 7547 / NRS-133) TaxID=590998 RepID=F4H4J7_CELFA|nr:VOC family protein [Cellulomonas fimi]AEE47792.1 Glyoxalase/bleomycin resistance protein/dioxygenase [Cellulomonas fimi ATCC 484]NNH06672.1 VOC family protein [Cellulomonas fimi]VEH37011.1 3-demethylubiquinone-9 3-methyltransferase [Cellulomonas fimi]